MSRDKPAYSIKYIILLILSGGLLLFAGAALLLFRVFLPGVLIFPAPGSPEAAALRRLPLFLVCFFSLFVFFFYLILRFFLNPLEKLARDIHRVSSADRLDPARYASGREIRALCGSINDMLEKLNQSTMSTGVFRSIFNGMDANLFVSDPETGEILFLNDAVKKHYNLDDRAVGKPCWEVFQSGYGERCPFCPIPRLLENPGETIIWEKQNGRGECFKNTDCLIEWGGGKYAHLQHSIDISDLKAAEASLTKRLEQQELMSAISQSFISTEDVSTLIDKAIRMTGEFMNVSRAVLARIDPETKKLRPAYTWENSAHGAPRQLQLDMPFGPGEISYETFVAKGYAYMACNDVEANPETIRDMAPLETRACVFVPIRVFGAVRGILCVDDRRGKRTWEESDVQLLMLIATVIAGVISRSETEEQLIRMSSIVDSSPQFICYVSSQGRFKYMNQAALNISRYSREELMDRGLSLLFDQETFQKIQQSYIPRVLRGGTAENELPMIRRDGEVRLMSVSAFVTADQSDGFGAIALDITERRQLERDLIAAKEQAEQSSLAKSNFLSRMSHEMRTPMNAIIGMTAIARNSRDPEKMEYYLSKITEASTHLLGVINDILDMSKIEAGKFELSYSEFDFEKMLQRVTNVMNFRIDEKKQNLTVHIGRDVPKNIIADEQRLAQVLTNLLSNACKFTPEEGTITMGVTKTAQRDNVCTLRLEVADTGIGISPEQRGRLFSLFEQADGSIARKYGGTGLGLAISKSIVELMGGEIWVDSEPGRGSTFIFEITVQRGTAPERRLLPGAERKNIRLLAVDDSPEVLEYFSYLAESLGLSCTVASGGEEALGLIQNAGEEPGAPDLLTLVFADWRMPGMNGIELTRKIKERRDGNIVVIMISAAEWETIEAEARAAGVDGFIPKPLFPSQIVDCVNRYVQNSGAPEAEKTGGQYRDLFAGRTVLLAEDMELNREIVITLLEDTGVRFESAENGVQAVRLFEAAPEKYDAILMDIHMPEMDGFEATRRIRALPAEKARQVPIIAMTANVFREDIEKCLAAGMNDHLGKPIDIDEVLRKLKHYLPQDGFPGGKPRGE
jgi:PAS domain S-box-containing protein